MSAPQHSGLAVLAGAALSLALTACTTPDAAGPAPAGTTNRVTSSPPTSTVSPADVAREKAVAAYVGMWDDMVEAARTSDWQDPDLGRHATKDALRVITGSLYADHRNGLITKGRPTYDPEVTSVKPRNDPTTVMIADCGDSSGWLKYRREDNRPADGERGGRRQITAEVKVQKDGEWRVTRFAVQGIGTC